MTQQRRPQDDGYVSPAIRLAGDCYRSGGTRRGDDWSHLKDHVGHRARRGRGRTRGEQPSGKLMQCPAILY